MKRVLVWALSIVVALSLAFPQMAMAGDSGYIVEPTKTGQNLTWSIDSEGCFRLEGSGDYGLEEIKGDEESYFSTPWAEHCKDVRSAEINVTGITNLSQLFSGCGNLTSVDWKNSDTSKVTDMSRMFADCTSLTNPNLSGLNTSSVTDMTDMFGFCSNLTSLDLSKFDTSKVTSMQYMFGDCGKLATLDLSNFDTSKVTSMAQMFEGCSSLASLNVGSFNTSKVRNMMTMFAGCNSLTSLDVSKFDTSQVLNMGGMFSWCSGLTDLDLSSFNTSSVTEADFMFGCCSGLTSLDLSNFDFSAVSNAQEFLEECGVRTIKTPKNMKTEAALPTKSGEQWQDDNGNVYTSLPQNLNSSITIALAKVPGYGQTAPPSNPTQPVANSPLKPSDGTETQPQDPSGQIVPASNPTQEEKPQVNPGAAVTDQKSNGTYKVTNVENGKQTVTYQKPKDKNVASITIPATIVIEGKTYKVTAIADNTFKNNKKLKEAKLSPNIKTIGKNAFKGCKKLKKLTMGKNVEAIQNNAFKGCTSLKSITVPAKTKKIGAGAFANCKNLKKVVIKAKKLNGKTVGKKAFKGIPASATIDVPNSKIKAYKKLLRSKGLNSKCEIK